MLQLKNFALCLRLWRKGLKVSLAQKQPEYMFSTSIGIAQFGKDGSDFETLFKIADAALYIAKEKARTDILYMIIISMEIF